MAHNRKLVIGGAALVKARLKHDIAAMSAVRDEVEGVLIRSDFFATAHFKWIGLIIRFGIQNKFEPVYRPISKKDGDLPIAVEVDTNPLVGAGIETFTSTIRAATIEALLHVARKYNLPVAALEEHKRLMVEQAGGVHA